MKAASVAKEAMKTGKPVKEILLSSHLMDQKEVAAILDPRRMIKPGIKGLVKMRKLRTGRIDSIRRKHRKNDQ